MTTRYIVYQFEERNTMRRLRMILILAVVSAILTGCNEELPEAIAPPDFRIAGKAISSDFLGIPDKDSPSQFFVETKVGKRIEFTDEKKGRGQRSWHIEGHQIKDYTGKITYTFQKEGMIEVKMCKGDDCVRKYVYVVDPTPEPVKVEEPVVVAQAPPKKKRPQPKPEPVVEQAEVEEIVAVDDPSQENLEAIQEEAQEEPATETPVGEPFDASAPLGRHGITGVNSDLKSIPDENCTAWTSKAEIVFETSERAVLRELVVYSNGPGQLRLTWRDASNAWSETTTAGLIQGWSQISLSDLYAELNIPYIKYTLTLEIIGGNAQIAEVSSCSDIDFGGNNLPVRMEGNAALFNLKIDY
jgi:hypothetical protein